jgi:hypothetical protein
MAEPSNLGRREFVKWSAAGVIAGRVVMQPLGRRRNERDIEIGHRSTTTALLGNIAYRTGHPIEWDVARERILGDAKASAYLSREYRRPWKL